MIRIVFDPENLSPVRTGYILEKIEDYSEAYDAILRSFHENLDLTVIVKKGVVFQWLNKMDRRYPQGTFIFDTLDARQALFQKWGLPLPSDLKNEEIMEISLLNLDLQPHPGQSFEDILLVHFFTPLLARKTFPITQLPQLLQGVEAERWKINRRTPLLARILHDRMEEWKSKARSSEQRQVIDLFDDNPALLQEMLMQYRVLQFYPRLGESLMGNLYPTFALLKLQLQDLEVNDLKIPNVVSQVTYHLNAQSPQSAEELSGLIAQVSGLLSVEYETVENHLLAHPEWLSSAMADQIEVKFAAMSRRLGRRLEHLRGQIRPAKPQPPNMAWSVDQMLDWATNSYLPYQAWCSKQAQFNQDIYAIGDQFSDWLMTHWNDLHANSRRMVFNILPNIATELLRHDRVNLVLVVDNLGWSFAETLRDLFQQRGFYLLGTEPYVAMLPSETEISKKCLLSGSAGYISIDDRTYKGMLERGWVPYFGENTFRYISDIGSLGSVETIDTNTYVVNYLAVDKTLHRSSNEIGMSHRKQIRHLLESLVENVSDFVNRHTLGDRIRIHVVSDHGSTQIPAEMPNDLDPSFFKQTGFDARSHRYLEVSNERFATLADNLKLDCFFLRANDFYLPSNVLCARRSNRFLPVDEDVFVHGGLLPEEVIVPYMTFEPATVPLKNLDILLSKNQFRYRLETVELEIGNPNEAAVEQIQVSVLNGNVEWDCKSIPLLNGHHNLVCQASARFKPTTLSEEQGLLSLRIRFRCRGEAHTFDVKFPIVMKKMVEEKSANIFDD
ncbi:MAG TPA: hypothetical protein VK206_21885 [Anaerolineales bacterium]|nr:hypothetical protein [Anaerolineales bacterium]